MSKEQLKAFQEATQKDAGLQEKLRSASGTDDVVAIARAAGFLISAEELQMAQAELSDEELAGLAGGITFVFKANANISGDFKTWAKEKEGEYGANATIHFKDDYTN
jgi:predicted ribosomally synthesized peptide with nif11-like leader